MAIPTIHPFLHVYNPPAKEEIEIVEITRLEVVGQCPICSCSYYRSISQPDAPIRKSCNCTLQDTKDIWKLMLVK